MNIIFAAAPSQNETLAHLVAGEGIDWCRVRAFHMDEYIGKTFVDYLNILRIPRILIDSSENMWNVRPGNIEQITKMNNSFLKGVLCDE